MQSGLDYFPLDCQLEDSVELIEAEFGTTGFAVIIKLFQKIYGGKGYYCEWTKEVALLFCRRNAIDINAALDIVDALLKRGIFSKEIYEKYGVLTSRGIQKRYLEAVVRRKCVPMEREYIFLDIVQKYRNVDILGENEYSDEEKADNLQQRKVEESIVEKSKAEESKKDFSPPSFKEVQEYANQRNSILNAKKFFDYFNPSWIDSKGNPVRDWKQKFISWENREKPTGQSKPKGEISSSSLDIAELDRLITYSN